jgi:hypothetical protein
MRQGSHFETFVKLTLYGRITPEGEIRRTGKDVLTGTLEGKKRLWEK